MQKELIWGFTGQAGYVASRQVAIPQFFNLNAGQIGGGSASQPFFARNGNVGLNIITPINHTHYDSLQTNLSRRFSKGYMVNVGYTFSKALAICCDELADKNPAIQIPQFFNFNRALAPYDRTHVFTAAGIIELPFGKGKRFGSDANDLVNNIIGGWSLASAFTFHTGFAITALGPDLSGTNSASPRADCAAGVSQDGNHQIVPLGGGQFGMQFWNPNSLVQTPPAGLHFGSCGIGSFRGHRHG